MFTRPVIISGLALLIVGAVLSAAWQFGFLWGGANTVEAAAEEVYQLCAAGNENNEVCYEREIPARYGQLDIPQLFEVIRLVRARDPEYQFCHVTGHKLGELAVAQDPALWVDVIPLNPSDGLCSNGFIHGAAIGRFRDVVFDDAQMAATLPDFARACLPRTGWNPTPLDQAICFHGLGHLFMFITNAAYDRALTACEAVSHPPGADFSRVCREGVFMQTYQVIEPDDEELIRHLPEEPTRENYRRICAQFADKRDEGACLREAWPLFAEETRTSSGIKAFCSGQPDEEETLACYQSMFAILGRRSQTQSTATHIQSVCDGFSGEIEGVCLSFSARTFIEEDRSAVERAVQVCAAGKSAEAQELCFNDLANLGPFLFGGDAERAERLCAALPERWRAGFMRTL